MVKHKKAFLNKIKDGILHLNYGASLDLTSGVIELIFLKTG
jgi:hypothetical protein